MRYFSSFLALVAKTPNLFQTLAYAGVLNFLCSNEEFLNTSTGNKCSLFYSLQSVKK